jgi:hypothetical protein
VSRFLGISEILVLNTLCFVVAALLAKNMAIVEILQNDIFMLLGEVSQWLATIFG